jgi:hypothetical protein
MYIYENYFQFYIININRLLELYKTHTKTHRRNKKKRIMNYIK